MMKHLRCIGIKMKICNEHEEIVYEGKYCPLCEALENVKQLEEELQKTQNELDEAKDAINNHG
mgnify:CR=1 FL=1